MRLTILAVLAAAFCASVAAHVGIDIAGDYVLRVDSYDHVAHGSRELFTFVAVLCASGAAALLLRRLFATIDSVPRRLRLLRVTRTHALRWYGAVGALALCIVPVMETIDVVRAGGEIDSLGDAFGGSIALGASVTLVCAAAICAITFLVAGWLCRYRHEVARFVGALLVHDRVLPCPEYAQRTRASQATRTRELRAQRRSKRGPPLARRSLLVRTS